MRTTLKQRPGRPRTSARGCLHRGLLATTTADGSTSPSATVRFVRHEVAYTARGIDLEDLVPCLLANFVLCLRGVKFFLLCKNSIVPGTEYTRYQDTGTGKTAKWQSSLLCRRITIQPSRQVTPQTSENAVLLANDFHPGHAIDRPYWDKEGKDSIGQVHL